MNHDDSLTPDAVFSHLKLLHYFLMVACVILFYDHGLTFSQEVEHVWKRRFTLATLLFLVIRYLTPLEVLVLVMGFYYPALSAPNTCQAFVKFPGAAAITIIALVEIIMSLRTYALYGRNMPLLICLLVLLGCQVGLMGGSLVHAGRPVPLPKGVVGCILTGKNAYLAAFWLAPLVLDTTIFGLTLYKTRQRRRNAHEISLLRVILKDGIMYYVVICGINLLNVLVYLSAPVDLKGIGAIFTCSMTTVMTSRLVLNLQGFSAKQDLEQLELATHDRTNSGVLTTQIQPTLSGGPSEYVDENRSSLPSIRRASWFENLGDRLADEQWGTAGVREPVESGGMEPGDAKDRRDVEDMHSMDPTDRCPN